MRFPRLCSLTLWVSATVAFKDTSPFMFFSTSELPFSSPQITTAHALTDSISSLIRSCPSDVYVLIKQPGVHTADFQEANNAPYLRKQMTGKEKQIRSSFAVSNVRGEMKTSALVEVLEQKCDARTLTVDPSTGRYDVVDGSSPQILRIDFATPPDGASRSRALLSNDDMLASFLNSPPSSKYTVMYMTSPGSGEVMEEPSAYEMDTPMSPLAHIELKRGLGLEDRADKNNITLVSGPLFERYQFFTPGIFMGLLVLVLLLSIGYAGINALASIQVSYSAFDKEMGPAAQKKQQ